MSKLIDVSRNKQLQRMLIKFTESSQKILNESYEDPSNQMTSIDQEYPSNNAYDDQHTFDPNTTDQGSASSAQFMGQMKKGRHQSNIRVRDGKKKKSKQSGGYDFNMGG